MSPEGNLLPVALCLLLIQGVSAVGDEGTPEAAIAGFEKRVDAMFRAESGQPLKRARKNPPLRPGRGNYVRGYSYSMTAFASRCLYLGEMLEEANAALRENAQHYLDHPKDVNDRDSFHWHAETVLRLIDMYGTNGQRQAGLIEPETEAIALRPIFEYAKKFSTPERWEYETCRTWHVYESENHHAMSFTVSWHFARLARTRPKYRDVKYNGATPEQHYQAWNRYFIAYCRERARKGMFIEMMCGGYNSTLIKGIYNFHDFGQPEVRRAAGLLLDLYFAYWAQEQIGGVQGGGKSRVYFKNALRATAPHGMSALAWYYFGLGHAPEKVSGHDVNAALSSYRPPAVVADIALDVAGRGRYEVRQRPQGLGISGNRNPYRMKTDGGGILRYSYCDPAFILGTPMAQARPVADWAAISSQNRWQGAVFAGNPTACIVAIPRPRDDRVSFNGFWSVQHKGSLITQKLRHAKGAGDMIVAMSVEGLSDPVEEDSIVFVEAESAYAAIRVVDGGFTLKRDRLSDALPPCHALVLMKDRSPVILEVMAKADIESFDAFKEKVKSTEPVMDGTVVRYPTLYGDTLTLDTSYQETPTINGTPVDYSPRTAFESPFLNSDYNSGVVTISKGNREKVLDFNGPPTPDRAAAARVLAIGLIGDSTVADTYGWGPAFAKLFNDKAKVVNYAKNGATLDSLSKALDALLETKPDLVLVQFGHNDMKRYGPDAYSEKLREYVRRIQGAGVRPIIVSSVTRRKFGPDGKIVPVVMKGRTLVEFAATAGAVAKEMEVPFIDLYRNSVEHHNRMGAEVVQTYNFEENDRTHFSPEGERVVAKLVLEELCRLLPEIKTVVLEGSAP